MTDAPISYSMALELATQGLVHDDIYIALAKITNRDQYVWARRRVELFEVIALDWASREAVFYPGVNRPAPAPASS